MKGYDICYNCGVVQEYGIEIERIENASKDILEGFDGNRHENKGAKEALEMLIRHFRELETHGPQSFDITWNEEDVEKAFPEIPEEDRAEVLQYFEDAYGIECGSV